ncbi:MAG: glycosyltransferase [Woeseiaceae bacterium]|nr:glycosyltransferase [Woeseiaceae bacterium]
MPARVAIVIPHFEQPAALQRCVAAIAAQSYPADLLDVVVVDNGSARGSAPVLGDWPDVRLLVENRPGSYAARNRGVRETTAPIIAFTDADCVADPGWIEAALEALEACGADPAMLGGRIEMLAPGPRPGAAELYDYALGIRQQRFVSRAHFAATANLVATRSTFAVAGAFDERLLSGGDWEWGNRVHRAGILQRYAADAVVRHPLRTSLRAVLGKTRRTVGGVVAARRIAPAAGPRERDKLASMRATLGELRADPVTRPPWRFLRILLVALLVAVVRQAERLRIGFGGRAARR